MGLQSSWHQSDEREDKRYRHSIREQRQQKRIAKLRLVPPLAAPPTIVPGDYFRDHDGAVPSRSVLEYVWYGVAALGVHAAVGWWLSHLPPAAPLIVAKAAPVEMILTPPPEPETPPPPPPPPQPKTPPKVVKTEKIKVPHVVPTEPVVSDNVVAAEQGPITPQVIEPVPEVITAARADAGYLNNPVPEYPAVALRQGWSGTVQLRVLVKPDGSPGQIAVEKTSGKKALDEAALAAVKGWRFVPAKRGDTPIEGWVSFPVEFNLES
ncbi:MAG: energy transducer TonB [Spongiibacteraceae bacterium]